ncbi:YigZ family protein [Alteromonas gilva]|uniref:YigZ family protein n=1 Tax=Alteromonas gilva TaxID=2987522 RepID=A0ABT5KZB7_9ALTE|nr:YigZ family protein [Alteromonas gilva]MDC8830119.1 YigZ family protein [Alteromonas gilva]
MSYQTPDTPLEILFEVKKSKFFAFAAAAPTRDAAMQLLANKKAEYPDARHHCWAYLLGNPAMPVSVACADDGEPSGTAGKPILNVLQHKDVGDIMLIVTRYFGGIKLGAGGLVRAYSGAAQQVMEQLSVVQHIALSELVVQADFKHEQFIRHWVTQQQGEVSDCQYTHEVTIQVALPAPAVEEFKAMCRNQGIHIVTDKVAQEV